MGAPFARNDFTNMRDTVTRRFGNDEKDSIQLI